MMFAHKIHIYDDRMSSTIPKQCNMMMDFNQAVYGKQDVPPMTDSEAVDKRQASRLVSQAPFDEPQPQQPRQQMRQRPSPEMSMPHLVSASTTHEEEDSITGRYNNIDQKYHIDPRVLGTGHHGSVRECIERRTGRRFAVKSIHKNDPAVKPGGLAREIVLLQEMEHESIIRLVDMYENEEYVHLVTDLCEGGELFDKIVVKSECDNGSLCFTEAEAAKVIHQILEAISYLHKKDIAHRDIKPENVLFQTTEEGSSVKLIDFGLSRKHNKGKDAPMSTVVGTPYYIAPEVLRKKYDKSCDLWSVGVIAYILLCGYPPFNGADNDQTHKCVMRGRYYFPAEDWSDTSGEAMDFIYKLLQLDPRRRMTADQALNHPWIVKHAPKEVPAEEERQDKSSVEVLCHATETATPPPPPQQKRVVSQRVGDSPPRIRRKLRMSMFAF